MRKIKRTLFVSCSVLLAVGCVKITPKAPANPSHTKLLDLVNKYRESGCKCGDTYFSPTDDLQWNDALEAAAQEHSNDMYNNKYFDHTGRDGSSPEDRITKHGYHWTTDGENIAEGYPNEQKVIEGWIKSPGHCSNIMNPEFKDMGVATKGVYWTQDFGAQ